MIVLRAGISTSQPSRPKRFSEDHFRCRNSSNLDREPSTLKSNVHRASLNVRHSQMTRGYNGGQFYSPACSPPWRTGYPDSTNTPWIPWAPMAQITPLYLVDRTSLASRVRFSSLVNCMIPGVSNFCRIHWHCSKSLMNMNSTPMC